MNETPVESLAEVQPITLSRTTDDAYCRSVINAKEVEFWWYMGGLVSARNRWKPFQDEKQRWWWYVKPWFAWPVDFFTTMPGTGGVRPPGKLLGWQFPVAADQADSCVRLNVIQDLSGYRLEAISGKKRRWTIRKALREHSYHVVDPADAGIAEEAREVWNSHVSRTGWNKAQSVEEFRASWKELATMPGTTVVAARSLEAPHVLCAWLIGRVINDTAFIDTLTSHTDRVASGPNDGLVFLYLISAAAMGVRHAHYGLHSRIESLESFKRGLGFEPHPFPTKLHLRFPMKLVMPLLKPREYRRLRGDEHWAE